MAGSKATTTTTTTEAANLFIADTNNHRVLSLDVSTKKSIEIEFVLEKELPTDFSLQLPKRGVKKMALDPVDVEIPEGEKQKDAFVKLALDFVLQLANGTKQTSEATSFWFLDGGKGIYDWVGSPRDARGIISMNKHDGQWKKRISLRIPLSTSTDKETCLSFNYVVFYCRSSDGTCAFEAVKVEIPIVARETPDSSNVVKNVKVMQKVPFN